MRSRDDRATGAAGTADSTSAAEAALWGPEPSPNTSLNPTFEARDHDLSDTKASLSHPGSAESEPANSEPANSEPANSEPANSIEPGTEPGVKESWFSATRHIVLAGLGVLAVVAVGAGALISVQNGSPSATGDANPQLVADSTSPTTRGPNSYVEPQVGPGDGKLALAVAMTRGQSDTNTLALSDLRLGSVGGLATASDGRLFVSDSSARLVYEIAADNTSARIVAGSRSGVAMLSSVLRNPASLVVDSFGALVIADNRGDGLPSRVIRQDPTGQEQLLLISERDIVELHADEFGNIYVHLGPVNDKQPTNAIVRITDTGELTEEDIPLFTERLIPVAGGGWFRSNGNGSFDKVSLFGSAEVAPPQSATDVDGTRPLFLGVSSDRIVSLSWVSDQMTVISRSSNGSESRAELPPGTWVPVPVTATRPDGSLVIATTRALTFFSDPAKLEAGPIEFVKMIEAPTSDSVVPGLAVDVITDPGSLAVGPDGTLYWSDNSLTTTLFTLNPLGQVSRLKMPKPGFISEMVVTKTDLVVVEYLSNRAVVASYPLDTLRVGEESARSSQRKVRSSTNPDASSRAPLIAVSKVGELWAATNDTRQVAGAKRLKPKSTNVSGFAVDEIGFAVYVVDEGRLETDDGTIILSSVTAKEGLSASLLGLADDEVGTLQGWSGAITAIGSRRFVLADTATDRLMEIEDIDGTWMIRRFTGSDPAPSADWQDPIVQRTMRPRGVTTGPDGSVYFISENGAIRRVEPSGRVRTVAGGARSQSTAFGQASGLAVLAQPGETERKKIVVADGVRHRVNVVSPEGDISLVAGTGIQGQFPGDLSQPSGMAELNGVLYVADTGNHRVLSIDESGFVQVIAGTGRPGNGIPLGLATRLELNSPAAVAVAPDGRIVIADTENNRVLVVNSEGQVAKLFTVRKPSGLSMSTDESVFISARSDGQVFRLKLSGGSAEVFAGRGVLGYEGDGDQATKARLTNPGALATGPDGSLYIADAGNGAIRRVTPNGIINTVSGGKGEFGVINSLLIDPKLGMLFGDSDGRLFSISTDELTRVIPGWNTAR
jgi:sugar lactone lactonase YvrE